MLASFYAEDPNPNPNPHPHPHPSPSPNPSQERNKEVEELQAHILERRANGGGSVSESNRKIAALQKEYADFRTTSHHEREKMYNDLVSALSMVTEHKELIQAQIVDLKEYCVGKTELLQPLLAKD